MFRPYSSALEHLAMPWLSQFSRSRFWSVYQRLRRNPESLFAPSEEETLGKLNPLLAHAIESVPYYRSRLSDIGPQDGLRTLEDIRQLPITTKADFAAFFPDGVTSSKKEHLPWRYRSTSGTIDRLVVLHDYKKRDIVRASQLLALNSTTGYMLGEKFQEIPPDVCRNVCGATDSIEPSVYRYFADSVTRLADPDVQADLRGLVERQLLYRQQTLPSFNGRGLAQEPSLLDEYIRQIRRYRPAVLKALPAYLYVLALHILDGGIRPPRIDRGISPMGGSVSPYMKKVIERAFECGVHEDYGSAELGAIAAECGAKSGLHPFSSLFHVEVIRNGVPVQPGETGRILITDLYNYAMPFIRYNIGDVGVVHSGRCSCGMTTNRLDIQGRSRDCIVSDTGRLVTPDEVTDRILSVPGVLGFQLIVNESGEADLKVVPRRGRSPNLLDVQGLVADLVGQGLQIRTQVVPTIGPEVSGKFRFVKHLGWRTECLP